MTAENPWHFIDKFPGECTTEVSRKGNAEPCDRPAYAVAFDPEGYWPVCIQHARGQALVPLSEILAHHSLEGTTMSRRISLTRTDGTIIATEELNEDGTVTFLIPLRTTTRCELDQALRLGGVVFQPAGPDKSVALQARRGLRRTPGAPPGS